MNVLLYFQQIKSIITFIHYIVCNRQETNIIILSLLLSPLTLSFLFKEFIFTIFWNIKNKIQITTSIYKYFQIVHQSTFEKQFVPTYMDLSFVIRDFTWFKYRFSLTAVSETTRGFLNLWKSCNFDDM